MSFPGSVAHDADSQIETTKVTTSDATVTTLWSKEIPLDYVGRVRVVIVGRKSDSTARASYERVVTVYRGASGSAALGGSVLAPTTDYESNAAWDATLDLSTNTLRARVTGVAATTIYWRARVEFLPV